MSCKNDRGTLYSLSTLYLFLFPGEDDDDDDKKTPEPDFFGAIAIRDMGSILDLPEASFRFAMIS